MKKLISYTHFFILLLFICILAGCNSKDPTGKLEVTFANHPGDLTMDISPAENTSVVIYSNLKLNAEGNFAITLNAGNYFLRASSASAYPALYDSPGFQIQAGNTTKITFDSNNISSIQ